jgi:hypothetical protein
MCAAQSGPTPPSPLFGQLWGGSCRELTDRIRDSLARKTGSGSGWRTCYAQAKRRLQKEFGKPEGEVTSDPQAFRARALAVRPSRWRR